MSPGVSQGVFVPLTEIAIRKAKPRIKQYKLGDSGGLYLLIKPDGAKYWRAKYRHGGKEKLLSFGVYPPVTLAEARAERDKAKVLLKQGLDPIASRKRRRREMEIATANTFEVVARDWV